MSCAYGGGLRAAACDVARRARLIARCRTLGTRCASSAAKCHSRTPHHTLLVSVVGQFARLGVGGGLLIPWLVGVRRVSADTGRAGSEWVTVGVTSLVRCSRSSRGGRRRGLCASLLKPPVPPPTTSQDCHQRPRCLLRCEFDKHLSVHDVLNSSHGDERERRTVDDDPKLTLLDIKKYADRRRCSHSSGEPLKPSALTLRHYGSANATTESPIWHREATPRFEHALIRRGSGRASVN